MQNRYEPLLTALKLLALIALVTTALVGCSDPETPSALSFGQTCATSDDCGGGICVLEVCRACTGDEACATDYGIGATCGLDGACDVCTGQDGCACLEGDACDGDLTCVNGACKLCSTGEEGCECFGNDSCLGDLRCGADDLCETCPEGEEGCVCGADEACGDGLDCLEGLCAPRVCEGGEDGCPCRPEEEGDEDRCDEGLVCTEGGMCAECTPEFEGCPCDEEGACQNDLICDEGDETCRAAVVCADLGCVDNQLCDGSAGVDAVCLEACAEGFTFNVETGQCDIDANANCDPGAPGSLLTDCAAQNRVCVEDGDTASCGACAADFIEENGACRAAVTCGGLGCAAQNRACTPHDGDSDAQCGACQDGFEDNGQGQCVPLPQANCRRADPLSILDDCTARNQLCVEDGDGARCGDCIEGFGFDADTQSCVQRTCEDIDCAAQGRECGGEPLAVCGACIEGLIQIDPDNIELGCREALGCDQTNCEEGTFCVDGGDTDATCVDWPCRGDDDELDFRQVLNRETNACVRCPENFTCGDEGETGSFWPFFAVTEGRCICQTEPDYYYELGAQKAAPCDADGDGWVRDTARNFIESDDPELRTNARCDLQTIDRIVLENEYQQTMEVKLCVEGPVAAFSCESDGDCELGRCNSDNVCDCNDPTEVDLYETVRNDDQSELDDASDFDVPQYSANGNGRRLRASELNPMTRACINGSADINDNGVTDILEWHGVEPDNVDPNSAIDVVAFLRFGYFMELHDGGYERPLGDDFGLFRIKEKSRCTLGFPLKYDLDLDGDYWSSCTRNRDVDFDRTGDNQLIGHDFAEWNCAQGAGSCPLPPPLTDVTPDGEVPPHGLCDQEVVLPPVDGVWRGMNHHSQFKCVELVGTLPDDRDAQAPHQRLAEDITRRDGVGGLQLNTCNIECPPDDPDCAIDCEGGTCAESSTPIEGNPDLPNIRCRTTYRENLEVGAVGFASVRYIDSPNDYQRGCIDEFRPDPAASLSDPWKNLCPGFAINPDGVAGQGNPGNFGRVICGCGFNYGGANCDQGCAGDNLHFGGFSEGDACANGYCPVSSEDDEGGRLGFWMCGDTSTTAYLSTEGGLPALTHPDGWTFQGEVQKHGIETVPLCQIGDDCDTGWSLRP